MTAQQSLRVCVCWINWIQCKYICMCVLGLQIGQSQFGMARHKCLNLVQTRYLNILQAHTIKFTHLCSMVNTPGWKFWHTKGRCFGWCRNCIWHIHTYTGLYYKNTHKKTKNKQTKTATLAKGSQSGQVNVTRMIKKTGRHTRIGSIK